MADNLQELFARLKNQQSHETSSPAQQHGSSQPPLWAPPSSYHQSPSVTTPLFSAPIPTPNPAHSSNIIGPVNPPSISGTPGLDSTRTNNLLSLLKFNGQSGPQQGQAASPMANLQNIGVNRSTSMHNPTIPSRDGANSRPLSAADLMSNLQRSTSSARSPMAAPGAEKTETPTAANSHNQDFLLNLLTKPNMSQAAKVQPLVGSEPHGIEMIQKHDPDMDALSRSLAETGVDSASHSSPKRGSIPARQFGSPAASNTPFEAPQPIKASRFNYTNPFDQLNSSSPLNRTPQPEAQTETAHAMQPRKIEILKHNRDVSAQNGENAGPASKSRKIAPHDTASTASADNKPQQSVAEALEDVGEQVDKQVEQALAEADSKSPKKVEPVQTGNVVADQPVIKKEPAADDDIESSWESAEDDRAKGFKVEVYNFPMKPFVSLQIKNTKPARPIRQDHFMVIAQLKKEFDQIDRCLVTASQTHIVYAQVATKRDNGGFRIIRQDNGDHKQIFRSSGERIFSVQLCSTASHAHDVEAVLGTGVNGTVFWTSLAKSRGDLFADDDVEAQGFIMPPVQTAEETTSGSPVKTRAKVSSRHPDMFAVARGKQIFIVSPETVKERAYCDSSTRKANTEKYFNEHNLKINTGKAGKDFCFSEDDTVIVSLDKNGRFKFWDIRELTAPIAESTQNTRENVELREPLWTMNAAASGSKPDEKPSVSSIMFLDKERPFTKGSALRYMIIGFKQNHILQLWDLGLGKAVQEIRLPHEKDSDGICSISYHPKTGIVAVGHPTRNSIYFIHLSAPKYNIPNMPQANFVKMLASGDAGLPKPESTAIMSGIREFSFAKAGELRSVDMLRTPVDNASEQNSVDETLFELYVMHSKGVVGISVKREDLGWDAQSKMVNPMDALKEGFIEINDLTAPPKLANTAEQAANAESVSKQAAKPANSKKAESSKHTAPVKIELTGSPARQPTKTTKPASPEPSKKTLPQAPAKQPLTTPDLYSLAAQRSKSPAKDATTGNPVKNTVPPLASRVTTLATSSAESTDVSAIIGKQFDSLYQRIESDKRVQEAATNAKQDALLRLVSSTLTENVDRSLSDIITTRIEKDVIPTLTEVTSKVAERKIAEILPQQLNASVAAAMKASLSSTLQQALKDKEVHRTISEVTANSVAQKVQQQVASVLQQSLPGMANTAGQKMVADLEKRLGQQQRQAEVQRQQDNAKIEELSSIVRSLSSMVQEMAASQSTFQDQILNMQRESKSPPGSTRPDESTSPAVSEAPAEPEDTELREITEMLVAQQYEQGTIKWISSDRQAVIFDLLFVRVDPCYLQSVSPLVALTVSAAVTSSFDTYVDERLDWLGRVLSQVDMGDSDIRDVAPRIMDVLSQRLQGAYMQISEATPNAASLRTIAGLNRQVHEVRRLAQ